MTKVKLQTTTTTRGLFIGDKEVRWLPDNVYKSPANEGGVTGPSCSCYGQCSVGISYALDLNASFFQSDNEEFGIFHSSLY